jgi:hypothetical protein
VIDETHHDGLGALPGVASCPRFCCNEYTNPDSNRHGESDSHSDSKGDSYKESNANQETTSEEKEESHKGFAITQVAASWI